MNRLWMVAVFLLVLAGCTLTTNPQSGQTLGRGDISTQDLQSLQKVFMASYYASSGGYPTVARSLSPWAGSSPTGSPLARATVPINNTNAVPSNLFSILKTNSAAANTIANYPETGETTVFTVTLSDAGNNVYDIKATTTFPAGDIRSSYVEEYYVKDVTPGNQGDKFFAGWSGIAPDGKWTTDDPIVQPGSTLTPVSAAPWVWNQNYRKQMVQTFTDGTTRNETIVSGNNGTISGTNGVADPHFSPFAVNGSLDLGQVFVPSTTSDPSVKYSSVVVYETHPATNPNFWFWAGSQAQTIVGIRYYTEQLVGSTYAGSSISFEKTVSTNTTTGGSYATALNTLVGGSTFNTLAESVLREQVSWPYVSGNVVLSQASITKNMQTRVINITGLSSFYITQLNADYASISNFSTSAVYAPVGVVDTVPASNVLFTGNTTASSVTGALPLAVQTVNTGLGTLAQVYAGITTGTLTATVPSTPSPSPSSSLMSSGSSYSFGGQQTVGLTQVSNSVNLGKTGWVEAWVYLNSLTDTFGIVHYGQNINFSDEAYSLQGWSNSGQISMIVDTKGGAYDQVLSKQLLAIKKWYHIVGVWDVNAPNSSISLYINGVLDNTNTSLSNVKNGIAPYGPGSQAAWEPAENSVLIGSQLPSSYSTQYGYFGINGKIVGVNIGSLDNVNGLQMVSGTYTTGSSATLVAAQVAANYNASKGSTAGW